MADTQTKATSSTAVAEKPAAARPVTVVEDVSYPGAVSIERANDEQRLAEGMAAAENEARRAYDTDTPTQEEYRERRAAQQQEMYGVTTHIVDPDDGPDEKTVEEVQQRRVDKLEAAGVKVEKRKAVSPAEAEAATQKERDRIAKASKEHTAELARGGG